MFLFILVSPLSKPHGCNRCPFTSLLRIARWPLRSVYSSLKTKTKQKKNTDASTTKDTCFYQVPSRTAGYPVGSYLYLQNRGIHMVKVPTIKGIDHRNYSKTWRTPKANGCVIGKRNRVNESGKTPFQNFQKHQQNQTKREKIT